MFKRKGREVLVLLVHPGGPFWRNKDLGAWSIPKGEYAEGEDPLGTAVREFAEELGTPPQGQFLSLGEIKQPGGKIVTTWAVVGDFDPALLKSNMCEVEWPPRSGKFISVPEVDRADWFTPSEAKVKILPGQRGFVDRLLSAVEP